ncbi:MAG: hypothetical protein ACKOBW_15520 [Planctomycetota bacterium]
MDQQEAVSSVETTLETAELQVASQPFVGQWQRLVSSTNWEKGRIIQLWRVALVDSGAPASQYADEVWSGLVGGVTPQHVGRLRRVFQRFGETQDKFAGLYWSHFQAAIDWDDAEMWLEGARQSRWSVSQMRGQRAETLGILVSEQEEQTAVAASAGHDPLTPDEDFIAEPGSADADESPRKHQFDRESATGPRAEGPDFGDESAVNESLQTAFSAVDGGAEGEKNRANAAAALRPFAELPALPADLAEAVELLKIALLRHKTDGWRDVPCDDLLATLDALKLLAVAPQ